MAKKSRKESPHKLRPDVAETAFRVMLEATGQAPKTRPGEGGKNPEAVRLGSKGGHARGKAISKTKKSDIGSRGAAIRWKKKP